MFARTGGDVRSNLPSTSAPGGGASLEETMISRKKKTLTSHKAELTARRTDEG